MHCKKTFDWILSVGKKFWKEKISFQWPEFFFLFPETTHYAQHTIAQSRWWLVYYTCHRGWQVRSGWFESHWRPYFWHTFRHSLIHSYFSKEKTGFFRQNSILRDFWRLGFFLRNYSTWHITGRHSFFWSFFSK